MPGKMCFVAGVGAVDWNLPAGLVQASGCAGTDVFDICRCAEELASKVAANL